MSLGISHNKFSDPFFEENSEMRNYLIISNAVDFFNSPIIFIFQNRSVSAGYSETDNPAKDKKNSVH